MLLAVKVPPAAAKSSLRVCICSVIVCQICEQESAAAGHSVQDQAAQEPQALVSTCNMDVLSYNPYYFSMTVYNPSSMFAVGCDTYHLVRGDRGC